jgi:hypothetical protein
MRVIAASFLVVYTFLIGGLLHPLTAQSDFDSPTSDTLRIKSPVSEILAAENFNKGFNLNTSDLLLAQIAGLRMWHQ